MDAQHTADIEIQEAVIYKAINEIKRAIRILRDCWTLVMLALSLNTGPGLKNTENCHLN